VAGRTVGVLGLSFKPETDDMRDAPSLDIIRGLLERGAAVRAFDPVAMREAARLVPEMICCKDAYGACEDADALVIVTEWNEFRALNLDRIRKALRQPLIIDLRNLYAMSKMKDAGFRYVSVGRGTDKTWIAEV
jgi:UDPglucose 6-dehydrogenase